MHVGHLRTYLYVHIMCFYVYMDELKEMTEDCFVR